MQLPDAYFCFTFGKLTYLMTIQAQKLELIQWVAGLDDPRLIQQLAALKNQTRSISSAPKRSFGSGKNVFLTISDDFNDPINDFQDYIPWMTAILSIRMF